MYNQRLKMNDISVRVSVCKTKKCLLYLYILTILLTTVTVPVQDTTALVTLRDKPLGGNDSTPLVHVLCRMHTCQKYLKDLKYLGIILMYQYLIIFLSKLKDTEVNMVSFQFRIRYMWAGTDNTDPEQALWCQISITTPVPVPIGSGSLTINCSNNNYYLHGLEGESGHGSTTYPCLYFSNLIILNLFLNVHFITTEDALRLSVLNKLSILGAQNFYQIKVTGTGTGTALDCFNTIFYFDYHRLEGESGPGSVTYPSICFSTSINSGSGAVLLLRFLNFKVQLGNGYNTEPVSFIKSGSGTALLLIFRFLFRPIRTLRPIVLLNFPLNSINTGSDTLLLLGFLNLTKLVYCIKIRIRHGTNVNNTFPFQTSKNCTAYSNFFLGGFRTS